MTLTTTFANAVGNSCVAWQAYLTRAPQQVVQGGHLEGVLGVFQKLLASRAHFHEAFFILNALFEYLPLAALQPFVPTIWNLLLTRCTPCSPVTREGNRAARG